MNELPPLPATADLLQVMWRGDREFVQPVGDYFTADQMRAYAAEAVRVALEQAADELAQALCDDCENGVKWLNEAASAKFAKDYPHLRAALIALKGTP